MTHYQRTIAILAFLSAVATASSLYIQYGRIEQKVALQEKAATTSYIQERASILLFTEDFTSQTQDVLHQQAMFEGFFDAIQSPEIVRLKVWNKEHVVVWSNLEGLIGQKFPNNEEVAKAFAGEVEFEIEKQKEESYSERDYAELSEVYIPFAGADGNIVGVLEVYKSTVKFHEKVNREFRLLAAIVIGGVFLGLVIFMLLLGYIFKTLRIR